MDEHALIIEPGTTPQPSHAEEHTEISERTSPSSRVVYEAIRREGEDELSRTTSALGWSGLAAGLAMGFSFAGVGLLRAFLPEASWTPLVTAIGYTFGFLIVILGRQQLFTENTLTPMLPLLQRKDRRTLGNTLRLWSIVLLGNVVGALVFAFVLARTHVFEGHVFEALRTTAAEAAAPSFGVAFLRAIFAGWLIALVVWLMPFAESARIWVIMLLTYIIGLAHFSHVIVTTVDGSFRVFVGDSTWTHFLTTGFVPALLGNIVGGVAIVAAINHAQVVGTGPHHARA